MTKHFKLFNTHSKYETYINGSDKILPNMSYCVDNDEVHFNHLPDPRVIVKFNVTSTDSATQICYTTSSFSEMEIDGVVQSNVVASYTFVTTGEHTVKYKLSDPTSIDNQAFSDCTDLTSITIPSSVTSIGNDAFYGCTNLISINIPSGVTSIGNGAFQNCSGLTNIDIPSSVTSIGERAFGGCSDLLSIDIPSSVTRIDNLAFSDCVSLTSITIPSSVTSIGESAFSGCSDLISIDIPSSVTSIASWAFQGCSSFTSITIPSSVISIGLRAFEGCSSLNSITSQSTTAPTIQSSTFLNIKTAGTLYVPSGSTGYNVWMRNDNYYLGKYNWTKVEQ